MWKTDNSAKKLLNLEQTVKKFEKWTILLKKVLNLEPTVNKFKKMNILQKSAQVGTNS